MLNKHKNSNENICRKSKVNNTFKINTDKLSYRINAGWRRWLCHMYFSYLLEIPQTDAVQCVCVHFFLVALFPGHIFSRQRTTFYRNAHFIPSLIVCVFIWLNSENQRRVSVELIFFLWFPTTCKWLEDKLKLLKTMEHMKIKTTHHSDNNRTRQRQQKKWMNKRSKTATILGLRLGNSDI